MEITVILCFVSAACAGLLALGAAFRAERSVPRWVFIAGMAVVAAEGVLSGLSVDGVLLEEKTYWEEWRLLVLSCVPGIWFAFSLMYARGNAQEVLSRWKIWLIAGVAGPLALTAIFRHE